MNVLGIDPGTAATGYGLIAVEGSRMRPLEHGVIETPSGSAPALRLAAIFSAVSDLIQRHDPGSVALEDLYVGGNPRTVLSVGQARGAVLTACGLAGIDAAGYSPAEVKTAVCGFGRADKQQVRRMVGALLGEHTGSLSDHASDALAVAVCHAVRSRLPRTAGAAR